jgi:hypothetical protein
MVSCVERPAGYDRKGQSMIFDKVTWVGLMVAAFGWTLVVSTPQLTDLWSGASGRPIDSVALDLGRIAQCTILSGFGIAILGALQTGFGLLKKSLDAGLVRNSKLPVTPVTAQHPSRARKITERGWVKNRAYVLFNDGSVEVETMLGRRLFASMQDAQEFIA